MAHYAPYGTSVYPILTPTMTRMQPGRYDINVKECGETIPAILVVDSSQRNRDLYENPGRYAFQLPKQYTEVTSIELIQANIPCSGYAINDTNNVIHIIVDGAYYNTPIPVGNYDTPDALAAAIQLAINNIVGYDDTDPPVDRFDITVNPITRVFEIAAPYQFQFIYGQPHGADQILGLSPVEIKNTATGATAPFNLKMPYSYSLTTDPYIVLSILGLERCDSNNDAAQGAFCIIPLDINNNFSLSILNDNEPVDNDSYVYYFPEPLPKLTRLEIAFSRSNGSVYDFNGRDHFMVFRVTCKSRQKKPF